jgi:hypothetical protein
MKTKAAIEVLEARVVPATVFAIESGTNHLVAFDSAHPDVLTQDLLVTGLTGSQVVVGLDFNQDTGKLFAFAAQDDGAMRSGRAYTIDPATGVATPFGAVTFNKLADTGTYGLDVDPTDGSIRLTNGANQNFGIIANGNFNGNTLDEPNVNENIAAIAYDHNFGSQTTTLYGYNFLTDELVTVGSIGQAPDSVSSGIVHPIAKATVNGQAILSDSASIGFDIAGPVGAADQGWLSLSRSGSTHLYQVDLATAALTDLGKIGDGTRKFDELAVSVDAPAPTITGTKATWTDIDGDLVTLTVSKGTLTPANFRMLAGVNGSALQSLTLDATFAGANVTLVAKPGPLGGDGTVNVGRILAPGVDLGNVIVPGDLVEIDAGNAAAPAPSVKLLSVRSFHAYDTALLGGAEQAISSLADGAGKIAVAGDFGGHLELGTGKTGAISVGGDLRGSDASYSGSIISQSSIGTLLVKGSLHGGEGFSSGTIAAKTIASTKIGGSLLGNNAPASGSLRLFAAGTAKIAIGGSLIGGVGNLSGSVEAHGTTSAVIGGSLQGGHGIFSGSLFSDQPTGSFLKSAVIKGSVTSDDNTSGLYFDRIGQVTIGGDVRGTADHPTLIAARLSSAAQTQAASLGIARLTILGNLDHGLIGAGVDSKFAGLNPDAAIGVISIGKDLIASSIVAGIDRTNGMVGDADDQFAGGNAGSTDVIARIAGLTVGGQIQGTAGGPVDRFGIEAESIGFIKIGKTKLALTAAKDDLTTAFTADVRVREF